MLLIWIRQSSFSWECIYRMEGWKIQKSQMYWNSKTKCGGNKETFYSIRQNKWPLLAIVHLFDLIVSSRYFQGLSGYFFFSPMHVVRKAKFKCVKGFFPLFVSTIHLSYDICLFWVSEDKTYFWHSQAVFGETSVVPKVFWKNVLDLNAEGFKVNPPATKSELDGLWAELDELEGRS